MAGLKEVAEVAGVSASTVSRVLNGKSYVNEETRKRVLEAMEKTNFQLNTLAKGLKTKKSNTLCLMVPAIENLMIPLIVRGVEDTARKSGFMVVLCNIDEDHEIEAAAMNKMKTRWIDGFIICSAYGDESDIYQLQKEGFPVVLINRFQPEDENRLPIVSVDNYRAAYDGVRYLIRTGHKRIAIAHGREELFLYRERLRGYKDALKDAGIPYDETLVMNETNGAESFYQLTNQVMGIENPPDAIFASSDPKAFVIMHALHDLGKKIPEDVAVLGFDNVAMAYMVEPPLSTIAQPLYEIGCAGAKNVIRQIKYKEEHGCLPAPIHTILDHDLIIRRSTN